MSKMVKYLVNGQPVLFKGVNRHEHDEWTGHVVSKESMRKDIRNHESKQHQCGSHITLS